jgi:hypothetical protein
MKPNWIAIGPCLAVGAVLALSTLSSHAQNVLVNGDLSDVPAAGGVFDYTLTLHNTGTEAVQSLWLGWIPGSFNIANPANPGNTLGWTSALDGSSIQYAGTAGTALAAGGVGTFTFDSTTTPADFEAQTGLAGQSTAYGVNAANGQLSFFLSPPDTATFGLEVVPEPSTFALLGIGFLGFLGVLRRKPSGVRPL